MVKQNSNRKQERATEDGKKPAGSRRSYSFPEPSTPKYTTELDYISTWDAISYAPSDAFAGGVEIFADGEFDVGEEYPRGV